MDMARERPFAAAAAAAGAAAAGAVPVVEARADQRPAEQPQRPDRRVARYGRGSDFVARDDDTGGLTRPEQPPARHERDRRRQRQPRREERRRRNPAQRKRPRPGQGASVDDLQPNPGRLRAPLLLRFRNCSDRFAELGLGDRAHVRARNLPNSHSEASPASSSAEPLSSSSDPHTTRVGMVNA